VQPDLALPCWFRCNWNHHHQVLPGSHWILVLSFFFFNKRFPLVAEEDAKNSPFAQKHKR
ncbi:hypothetical protein Gotri_009707, partial [Gossypium trilobum]|nr:hypothetical protein [Gossypium trilobum]